MPGGRVHARIGGPADDLAEPSSDNGDMPCAHTLQAGPSAELADCHGPILPVMRITFQ